MHQVESCSVESASGPAFWSLGGIIQLTAEGKLNSLSSSLADRA